MDTPRLPKEAVFPSNIKGLTITGIVEWQGEAMDGCTKHSNCIKLKNVRFSAKNFDEEWERSIFSLPWDADVKVGDKVTLCPKHYNPFPGFRWDVGRYFRRAV